MTEEAALRHDEVARLPAASTLRRLEHAASAIRHAPILRRASWLWNIVRPVYERVLTFAAPRGVLRNINGTDAIRVSVACRGIADRYEPEVWRRFTSDLREGDVIADVGSFIGLYALAAAARVGPNGRVCAFEPDPANCASLRRHVELNHAAGVEVVQAAVADSSGELPWQSNGIESRADGLSSAGTRVRCLSLDEFFAGARVDVLKIDVEGYEESVLRGAATLLGEPTRRPRSIFIEVHPNAWPALGTTSDSLLRALRVAGYEVTHVDGTPVSEITAYGEVVARRSGGLASAVMAPRATK